MERAPLMGSATDKPDQRRVLAEGRFMRLVTARGWEWVERTNTSGAVVIAAVTADRRLVLIEQYRVPLNARVIELPAGLVGDTLETQQEEMIEAARRELLEETGYAGQWQYLLDGPSSAGLTTESYSLYLVRDARKVGRGGGDDQEDIHVHLVDIDDADRWLAEKRRGGLLVDPKIYVGLYFARCNPPR